MSGTNLREEPLSEPLDDLCTVIRQNIRLLKKAFKKPGALESVHNRLVRTFEEPQELTREGRVYGFAVTGMSKEAVSNYLAALFIAAFLILNWLVPTQIPFLAQEIGGRRVERSGFRKIPGELLSVSEKSIPGLQRF